MCDAIGSPPRAFPLPTDEAHTVPKDNTYPHCTPPSSPSKQPRPSTPRSTPLHRRFLKEVSMSPASPATPATPPRTPSRNQRDTPSKNADSPTKVRATPVKHSGSPAKLEIGQNGFYFSMEIPMSKITPKKQASPQKGSQAGTPTRRTPSPLKNETPVKRNPAKALFGTPAGKGIDAVGNRVFAPMERSVEDAGLGWTLVDVHDEGAGDLMSAPLAPLRVPPDCLSNIIEPDVDGVNIQASSDTTSHQTQSRPSSAHSAKDSRPETIGHMMARLTSGTFKTYEWAKAHRVDPIKSPAPTPLRRASQKLYSEAPPGFAKLNAGEHTMVAREPTKATGKGPPALAPNLQPLGGRYFDESKRVKSPDVKMKNARATHTMNPAGTKIKPKKTLPLKGDTTLQQMAKAEPSPYPELLFPRSASDPKLEIAKRTPSNRSEDKHVQWQGPIFSPSRSRYQPLNSHRRVGTDPEVYLAMQKDMASMGKSLRRSIGSVLSSSQPNMNELPPMSNTIFERDLGAQKPNVTPASTTRERLTRWNSDTPAVRTPRLDVMKGVKQRAATLTNPSVPMWKQSGDQPARMLREKIVFTAKEGAGVVSPKGKAAVPVTPRAHVKAVSKKLPSKTPTTPTTTPRRQPRTAIPATNPACPAFGTPAKKPTPAVAPPKSKPVMPATPRTATKPRVPHTPITRPTPSTKPPASSRKLIAKTPNPPLSRKLPKPATPPPYDPADPRPYEEKFASAAVIAERVTQWHSEEREKSVAAARLPSKIPSKGSGRIVSKGVKDVIAAIEESCTPPTSPNKQPTRSASPTKLPIRAASPTKLPIRAASPAKPSASTLPKTQHQTPAKPKPTTTRLPPRTPATIPPRTPLPTKSKPPTITTTTSSKFTPHTPLHTPLHAPGSRIAVLDRNAFRTPSKAIQSSLDRAIDEKIREDARAGREVTIGGQRVGELLGWMGGGGA
ncbi:hypothetical protein NX059_011952 [Plenodomus lindquistii]|nr:hypothetical protein NX059_011952 [Plenodomus lindquistii]